MPLLRTMRALQTCLETCRVDSPWRKAVCWHVYMVTQVCQQRCVHYGRQAVGVTARAGAQQDLHVVRLIGRLHYPPHRALNRSAGPQAAKDSKTKP